jgi:putative tryptophan/tyrosine transport system substrate-binding protein
VLCPDPVSKGLVESLPRPGGNATGLSLMTVDLSGKRLALLTEAVPNLSRVAVLVDPRDPFTQATIKAHHAAAELLGISLWPVEVMTPDDIEPAFSEIAQDHAEGVILGTGAILFDERARTGSSALAHRLPTIGYVAEMVPFGILLSYGQDIPDYFRRAVTYTDKILKGAKPAALPVEQPTRFKPESAGTEQNRMNKTRSSPLTSAAI